MRPPSSRRGNLLTGGFPPSGACRVYVFRLGLNDVAAVFVVCGSQGGPIAFPRLKTGDSIEAWCKEVVQGCGVLLLPANMYDHQASTERGHFR